MKKKNRKQYDLPVDDREDRMILEGVVDEAMPGTLFRVQTTAGITVLATLAGKLRLNRIRILPGDKVTVEVSPYDTSKGRITWRGK